MSDSIHTTTDTSAEQRAWDEITRLTSAPGGPGAAWRWSIPARPERDSDLILAAGLKDLRDRLDAVTALHRKQTRYMLEGYEERSWDSEEDARAWDDMGWQTGKPLKTFDVCAECSRVEWESVDQQTDGQGSMGITSEWPCRTAQVLGIV